ncbi:MAG: radical SAM protein [Chloroflexi bacterium]|jgi:uncharacterized protein|nr:radical SAM protein [Chloroflexota bacterium]
MESARYFIHPFFGDLRLNSAVSMPSQLIASDTLEERRPYYIHLSVTGRCNAKCVGCVNSNITFRNSDNEWLSKDNDTNPQRDATAILNLTEGLDEKEIVVSFYGGEPLLLPEKILEIMSILSASGNSSEFKYMVYTNGQLLGDVIDKHPELIPKIWLWSVSIDGAKEQHNSIRPGTDLDSIQQNLHKLSQNQTGQVLMWSTIREEQSLLDCFSEFLSLYNSDCADLFFWHWVETESPFRSLQNFAVRYERDLRRIMDVYVVWLAGGRILPIIHLNELILYLLTGNERETSACAVELARNFDIMGGKIHSCADLPPEYAVGTIDDTGIPHVSTPA